MRNITSPVLPEEKQKPRSVAHEEMVFRVCWSARAALWRLEDRREMLKSPAKSLCVRGKETHVRMSSIRTSKNGTLHTSL